VRLLHSLTPLSKHKEKLFMKIFNTHPHEGLQLDRPLIGPLCRLGSFHPDERLVSFLSHLIHPQPQSGVLKMNLTCPQCQSDSIGTKNLAKKTGGTIGTVAGAASGAAGAMGGAEIGASAGLIAGPVGAIFGGIVGAILGGLFGGAAGGTVGARLGEVVDDTVLDNCHCLQCGYCFSLKRI
jgi:hypothetical protein